MVKYSAKDYCRYYLYSIKYRLHYFFSLPTLLAWVKRYAERRSTNKRKVLLLSNKWHDLGPQRVVQDMPRILQSTFDEAFGDQFLFKHIPLDECFENNPANIYSPRFWLDQLDGATDVCLMLSSSVEKFYSPYVLNFIIKKCKIKLYLILSDSVWPYNRLLIYRHIRYCEKINCWDSADFGSFREFDKPVFFQVNPFPISDFYPVDDKDIDVLFFGRFNGRPDRKNFVDYLENQGINILSNEKFGRVCYDNYVSLLRRSKIVINFASTGDPAKPLKQLKGRSLEAFLCGCLLMEDEGSPWQHFAVEGMEYVSFKSPTELIEKIKFFLENNAARKKICAAALRNARKNLSAEKFWASLLAEV